MHPLDRPDFVRRATIIVSMLIGIAVIALGVLAYLLFVDDPGGGSIAPAATPTAKQAVPQPTDTPAIVWGTPTRMSHQMLNQMQDAASQATPAPQPTAIATPPATQSPSATDAPSPAQQATPFAHPTYQPTTQPCEACHDNLRDFINPQ